MICDRLTAWELVEFLQVPIEEVVEVFEARIEENLDEIEELIGLRKERDNDE